MGIISFYSFTCTLVCVFSRFFWCGHFICRNNFDPVLLKLLTNWLNMLIFFRFTDVDQFVNIRDAVVIWTLWDWFSWYYYLLFPFCCVFFPICPWAMDSFISLENSFHIICKYIQSLYSEPTCYWSPGSYLMTSMLSETMSKKGKWGKETFWGYLITGVISTISSA